MIWLKSVNSVVVVLAHQNQVLEGVGLGVAHVRVVPCRVGHQPFDVRDVCRDGRPTHISEALVETGYVHTFLDRANSFLSVSSE
jgi:hypothetical protein